jgi:lycopene cyclase domain-containing protein
MTVEYALVLLCIVIGPLILSRDKKLGLATHPRALAKSIAIVCAVFWIWDVVATAREHWWFNDSYVVGPRVLGMPIEEWLFFVVLSFVSIFTWESTKYFLGRRQ